MSEFERLDELADALDLAGVERTALAALRDAAPDDVPDLWRYVAWARFEEGRLSAALTAARSAGDPLLEAKAQFHLWRLAAAAEALGRCEDDDVEDAAEAEWYRGLVAEFEGRDAAVHFAEAARLAGDLFHEPVRLTQRELDGVIRDALAALPESVRSAIADAAIEVLDLPEPDPEVDPLSLGLYQGVDRMSRSAELSGVLPSRIQVFRRNVERIAPERDVVIDELRVTLLHEIGHHLGYDEDDLARLDLA